MADLIFEFIGDKFARIIYMYFANGQHHFNLRETWHFPVPVFTYDAYLHVYHIWYSFRPIQIHRLSPPAPQKLARPSFFYFAKITFSGKIWCPTQVSMILFSVIKVKNTLGAKNDTPFVDRNKIVINNLSLGKQKL
jgi:hypothetical protein